MIWPDAIDVIDSHTEGEPTRVVISGWPALEARDMAGRRREVATRWDHLRRAVVCEPRGHDAVVGALLTEPVTEGADAGVVFFNNVGCLGMCGHGLIGVVRTLAEIGRLSSDVALIDTPVGPVRAVIGADSAITIRNVPAHCHAHDVAIETTSLGRVTGDVAYGGNWFFITHVPGLDLTLRNANALTQACEEIMAALSAGGITGDGASIDHVELTAPAPAALSTNGASDSVGALPDPHAAGTDADTVCFVLCPGGAWDRSPCGTGTSAKLASLHSRGQLEPGRRWRQRSITGGLFTAWLEEVDGALHPFVSGRAWITGTSRLRFVADDPLRAGFTSTELR